MITLAPSPKVRKGTTHVLLTFGQNRAVRLTTAGGIGRFINNLSVLGEYSIYHRSIVSISTQFPYQGVSFISWLRLSWF